MLSLNEKKNELLLDHHSITKNILPKNARYKM